MWGTESSDEASFAKHPTNACLPSSPPPRHLSDIRISSPLLIYFTRLHNLQNPLCPVILFRRP